jgi:hypothetical protein
MDDIMNHLLSPFLEEIIQYLDQTLCNNNRQFAELSRDLRIYTGLLILSAAGIATEIAKPGHDHLWEPTTTFLPVDIQRKPEFAPLVVADFQPLQEEVAQSSLQSAQGVCRLVARG